MKFALLTLMTILCGHNLQYHASAISLFSKHLSKAAPPPATLSREDTHAMIKAAALRHNVPCAFVQSIVAAESNFDPTVVSAKGAIGLMQLMPQLAQEFGIDPRNPEQNIDGGTRYLKQLIQRYQKSRDWMRRTIAAYNAGPGMVDKYRGVPPFRETRTYVARVLTFYRQFQREG
jgi:soluble lytic murein transglycosylase-like protein